MKIYTKTGDQGKTGLFGGPRVSKDDPRIEAYGTIDELNSVLGMARALHPDGDVDEVLERVQNELFAVGAELATPDPLAHSMTRVDDDYVRQLETDIDRFTETQPPLKNFILPAGSPLAAQLHLARAICRRAERRLVTLARTADADVSERLIRYVNRLSDLLFVLARTANQQAGTPDVPWKAQSAATR